MAKMITVAVMPSAMVPDDELRGLRASRPLVVSGRSPS